MESEDPERRIAELERELAAQKRIAALERQLADAKAAAREGQDGDEHARGYAQSVWEGLRAGAAAGPDGTAGPEMAAHREAFMRAATQAGLSREQIDGILQNGTPTINVRRSVVYSNSDQAGAWRQYAAGSPRPAIKRGGASRIGTIIGVIGGVFGICVGGAAAVIAMFPSTALWMSPLICRSPYTLAFSTSHYSYKPGQSGTSVSFQCVSGDGWYSANTFMIDALQSILIALALGALLVVIVLIRGRLGKSGA